MFDKCAATVLKGNQEAHFLIKFPRDGGYEGLYAKMLGVPKSMTGYYGPQQVRYGINMTVDREESFFSYTLEDPFGAGKNAETLDKRVRAHYRDSLLGFPLAEDTPSFFYDKSDKGNPRWLLTLPPKSAIYTSYAHFWELISIKGYTTMRQKRLRTRTQTGSFTVYGFWNGTSDVKQFRGGTFMPLEDFAGRLLLGDLQAPAQVQMQVELYPLAASSHMVSATPFEAVTAVANLEMVITEGGKRSNIDASKYIKVQHVGGTVIKISNVVVEDSDVTISMTFLSEMANAFKMARNRNYAFRLRQEKAYFFDATPRDADAFAGKYPVSILADSFGEAKSWIDGVGYCIPLGIMNGPRQMLMEQGLVFDMDNYNLRVRFIDNRNKIISFEDNAELHLILAFTPL